MDSAVYAGLSTAGALLKAVRVAWPSRSTRQRITSALVAVLLAATGAGPAAIASSQGNATPRYVVRLTPSEFRVLLDAAQRLTTLQGRDFEFAVRVERANIGMEWIVTVRYAAPLDTWRTSLGAEAADIVSAQDLEKMSDSAKRDLITLKSVIGKLDASKAKPIWDLATFAGTLSSDGGNWRVANDTHSYKVTGQLIESLRSREGKGLVVTGRMKASDEMEVTRFGDRKPNTLDIFVMSHCPYAKRAESAIIAYLREIASQGGQVPKLEVHYILYKRQSGDREVFTSMHGEEELNEDLVQIVIRDKFGATFEEYLLQRAKSDSPWQQVARNSGLDDAAVSAVETEVKANRDDLLSREYDHVAELYLVYDGSPTYIWEGVRIPDIRQAPPFATLDVTAESCSGG